MTKIQVLMSTYNGERYLEEQIQSVLNQESLEVSILIRDDGSKDKTTKILKKYEEYPNINIVYGENKGVISSFFELLKLSDESQDLYAFCDQDDFWEKDKLAAAANLIKKADVSKPVLYCSRTKLVNEHLEYVSSSPKLTRPLALNNALIENAVTGCTAVFNKDLRDEVLSKDINFENIVMHDWWIYLVAVVTGTVILDENSYIQYRQHESNVVGSSLSLIGRYKKRIKRVLKNTYTDKNMNGLIKQANEFYNCYGKDLALQDQQIMKMFLIDRNIYMNRIKLIKSGIFYRQKKLDTFYYYLLVLFGRN